MSTSKLTPKMQTGLTGGKSAWATEFERIFVLGAARIRGEKLARHRHEMHRPSKDFRKSIAGHALAWGRRLT